MLSKSSPSFTFKDFHSIVYLSDSMLNFAWKSLAAKKTNCTEESTWFCLSTFHALWHLFSLPSGETQCSKSWPHFNEIFHVNFTLFKYNQSARWVDIDMVTKIIQGSFLEDKTAMFFQRITSAYKLIRGNSLLYFNSVIATNGAWNLSR